MFKYFGNYYRVLFFDFLRGDEGVIDKVCIY